MLCIRVINLKRSINCIKEFFIDYSKGNALAFILYIDTKLLIRTV